MATAGSWEMYDCVSLIFADTQAGVRCDISSASICEICGLSRILLSAPLRLCG